KKLDIETSIDLENVEGARIADPDEYHREMEKITDEIVAYYQRIEPGMTRDRFDALLEKHNPAYLSVRKGAEEMAAHPFATLGQPIYAISGKFNTMFTRMNGEAAVIGAFYAAAAEVYSRGRA